MIVQKNMKKCYPSLRRVYLTVSRQLGPSNSGQESSAAAVLACATATRVSYRVPIFETSATALCGTTGKGLNGFNKRSDSFGTGDKQDLFLKKCSDIFTPAIFWTKNIGLPRILATIVNLPNIAGALNNLDKLATIANLDTNQDTTLRSTPAEEIQLVSTRYTWVRLGVVYYKEDQETGSYQRVLCLFGFYGAPMDAVYHHFPQPNCKWGVFLRITPFVIPSQNTKQHPSETRLWIYSFWGAKHCHSTAAKCSG